MATCKDCLHNAVCDMPIITDGRKNADNCGHFKNKADFAEVRHGKWIEKEHLVPIPWDCQPFDYENYDEATHSEIKKYWHCSCCNYEASRSIKPMHKYCLNCGALMDGRSGGDE